MKSEDIDRINKLIKESSPVTSDDLLHWQKLAASEGFTEAEIVYFGDKPDAYVKEKKQWAYGDVPNTSRWPC